MEKNANGNGNREMESNAIKSVEEAVYRFFSDAENNRGAVIDFLRKNKREINEFCQQVREQTGDNARMTVNLLSMIIQDLLN